MEITKKLQNLFIIMKQNDYQIMFKGDDDRAVNYIGKTLKGMVDYQNAVIQETAMMPIYTVRYADDPESLRDIRMQMDRTRRINHDAAISDLKKLNRICENYGVEPIANVDTEDRYAVADFIGQFCAEVYEQGQDHDSIKTADQLYEHRKGRDDVYDSNNVISRLDQRIQELNALDHPASTDTELNL